MSPRPDGSAERKPQILTAALQVFLAKGLDSARMEDIAVQAELSVGNLYRYFSGKLDLTVALMDLLLAPSLQKLEELLNAPGTSRQRLETAFLDDLSTQGQQEMFLYAEMYHLARKEPAVRQMLQSYNARYQKQIELILAQGIERGELRSTDPTAAAFAFQAIYDGVMQNLPLMQANFDLTDTLHQNFEIFFNGLSAP